MEKTMEERAEIIYKGNTIEQDAYIKGATEQRKIDIEKACEWMANFKFREEFPLYDYVGNFRKAMGE